MCRSFRMSFSRCRGLSVSAWLQGERLCPIPSIVIALLHTANISMINVLPTMRLCIKFYSFSLDFPIVLLAKFPSHRLFACQIVRCVPRHILIAANLSPPPDVLAMQSWHDYDPEVALIMHDYSWSDSVQLARIDREFSNPLLMSLERQVSSLLELCKCWLECFLFFEPTRGCLT